MDANPEIKKYLSAIGKKGGEAGRGSPAKLASATNAANIRWAKEDQYIYAFKKRGVFMYVGQTNDPDYRKRKHISKKGKLLVGCSFSILRKVDKKDSHRIERQIILSLKKRGQCILNKSTPTSKSLNMTGGNT